MHLEANDDKDSMARLEAQVPADLGSYSWQFIGDALDVLVTTTRQTDDDILVRRHRLGQLDGSIDTVRGFQGRDDTLELADEAEAGEGLLVRSSDELGAVAVFPGRQLWADGGVIQTSRHGVCVLDLTVLVLKHICLHTVQNTLGSSRQCRRVARSVDTITTSLNTQKLDGWVVGEGVEHAHSIAATTNACNNGVGQFASLLKHLLLGLVSDDGLEGSDNGREGVRSNGGTDDVVGILQVHNPGSHGLVDGVSEGAAACLDSNDLGTQQLHSENIEGLSAYILLNWH